MPRPDSVRCTRHALATLAYRAAKARFFAGLTAFDRALRRRKPDAEALQKIVQGPIADALTHTGQLALLRGMCGARVRPESYARAAIRVGKVGRDQAQPRAEFAGDASHPARPKSKRQTQGGSKR